MARATKEAPPLASSRPGFAPLTLALWRLRRTWGLLLATGVGMVIAVTLVAMGPFYSLVTTSGGLRQTLSAQSENADLVVHGVTQAPNVTIFNTVTARLNQEFQQHLGPYLGSSRLSIETPLWPLLSDGSGAKGGGSIELISDPVQQAPAHLKLMSGRLPTSYTPAQAAAAVSPGLVNIEAAISPDEAQKLHAAPGSTIISHIAYISGGPLLQVHITGIFTPHDDDSFWHGHDFKGTYNLASGQSEFAIFVDTNSLLQVLTRAYDPLTYGLILQPPLNDFWTYRLDPTRISADDLDTILTRTHYIGLDIQNHAVSGLTYTYQGAFAFEELALDPPADALQNFHDRLLVARVPALAMLALAVALALFFVSMMADLLVDRQAEAIAILRSRGTSRGQVFGIFITQALGLGSAALLLGPPLALLLVILIAPHLLAPTGQSAISLISARPLAAILSEGWLLLGSGLIVVAAMCLSMLRAVRADIVTLRREQARSTHRPIWQRLNLDLIALVVMLAGFAATLYLVNSSALDVRARLLLISPLTLLGALCLLIAGILLFLRIFPSLLRLGAFVTTRGRGAAQLLAVAQMARSPRQPVRMTLLLALATAFAIFSLVFMNSQAQRAVDVAAFQAGADFSGQLAVPESAPLLASLERSYRQLPGVLGASLGYNSTLLSNNSSAPAQIELRAVDSATFASAAIWNEQDATQPLAALMRLLAGQRGTAGARGVVPAIVDQFAVDALHLAPGQRFTLGSTDSASVSVSFVVVAIVQHIPTVSSAGVMLPSGQVMPSGGVLVDFQTYTQIFDKAALAQGSSAGVTLNYAWLRTVDDPQSLARIRAALNDPANALQIAGLQDRRALQEGLSRDPLTLNLLGMLLIGAMVALLLALLGNLLASWLSARGRQLNFAVMRALGISARQVVSVLTWEQGIIYTCAILLGIGAGALLSWLVVPALLFSGVPASGAGSGASSGAFYVSQSVPPIRVVVSPWPGLALLVLAVVCAIALALMVRTALQGSPAQLLRLNED